MHKLMVRGGSRGWSSARLAGVIGVIGVVVVVILGGAGAAGAAPAPAERLVLGAGWTLQSSAKVPEPGDVLSTTQFRPTGWYPVTVPSTVVAALVKQKV